MMDWVLVICAFLLRAQASLISDTLEEVEDTLTEIQSMLKSSPLNNDVYDSSAVVDTSSVDGIVEQNLKAGHGKIPEYIHEGDMRYPPEEEGNSEDTRYADAISDSRYRWPKSHGAKFVYVPYAFDTAKSLKLQKTWYQKSQKIFSPISTCIRIIPHDGQVRYITIKDDQGCWADVGYRSSGLQEMSLASGCEPKDKVLHEFMHSLGFYHEQQRPDRNSYINVIWENIRKTPEDYTKEFDLLSSSRTTSLSTNYDKDSITHYGNYIFSKDRTKLKTMVWKADSSVPLGGKKLSPIDITRINRMYGCRSQCAGVTAAKTVSVTVLNAANVRAHVKAQSKVYPMASETDAAVQRVHKLLSGCLFPNYKFTVDILHDVGASGPEKRHGMAGNYVYVYTCDFCKNYVVNWVRSSSKSTSAMNSALNAAKTALTNKGCDKPADRANEAWAIVRPLGASMVHVAKEGKRFNSIHGQNTVRGSYVCGEKCSGFWWGRKCVDEKHDIVIAFGQ